jgi:hybrid cluster-associated redox disulfide protein
MADLITKDMGIMEAIQKYPDVVGVFVAHGLGCIGCAMANFETIEQGATAHGMDIDALMKDLNEAAIEIESKK